MKKDLYEILGISKNADEKEIKKAYRESVKQYHPDTVSDEKKVEYEEKMKEINVAYSVLSDTEKRSKYDRGGWENLNQNDVDYDFSFNMRDIFGPEIFQGFFNRGRQMVGSDIHVSVERNLSQSWQEEKRNITYNKVLGCEVCGGSGAENSEVCSECSGSGFVSHQSNLGGLFFQSRNSCAECNGTGRKILQSCSQCHGKGITTVQAEISIDIPKGAIYHVLILDGMGNNEHMQGVPGNLLVHLKPIFSQGYSTEKNQMELDILVYQLLIPLSSALGGGGESFQHPLGHNLRINIPAGTQDGERIVMAEQGFPMLRSEESGSLIIEFKLNILQDLSSEQQVVIEQMKNVGL